MRYLWAVLAALLLAACSGDSHDRYVGLWKLEDGSFPAVLAITKEDSKTYLINENILQETDFFGNKKKGRVLDLDEKGGMGINIGFGIIPLALSENGKTLRVDNRTYGKISESDFTTFKAELEKNEKLCKQLKEEYNAKREAIKNPEWNYEESRQARQAKREAVSKQRETLRETYRGKLKQIPYCDAGIW